jgi:hypothetical protein
MAYNPGERCNKSFPYQHVDHGVNPATGCLLEEKAPDGICSIFARPACFSCGRALEEGSQSTLKPRLILYAPKIHCFLAPLSILFHTTGQRYPRID